MTFVTSLHSSKTLFWGGGGFCLGIVGQNDRRLWKHYFPHTPYAGETFTRRGPGACLPSMGAENKTTCLKVRDRHMVPTFPDRQNSLTFPVFFPIFPVFFSFPQYFFKCLCFKLKNWSILANNTQLIYISLIILNNIYLKFCHFSSILCDFPWLFQSVQNSLTGKCLLIFPGFPVGVGTLLHSSREFPSCYPTTYLTTVKTVTS